MSMESTPPRPGAQPNKAPSAHELLQAASGLMGRIDQIPAFVRYCVKHKREFNDKHSPAYWAAVSDFARDNREMFEQSFGKRGASFAHLVFATPAFVHAERRVTAYQRGEERMDYMEYRGYRGQLRDYHELIRRAIIEHPTQRPTLLRNHLHAAAHVAGLNSPDAERDIDAQVRGVLAEVDFETLTAEFDDVIVERGDMEDDAEGTDYRLMLQPGPNGGPKMMMKVDVKASARSLRYALDDVRVLSHVETEQNEHAVIQYMSGSVNVLLHPYKLRRDDYPFRLPDEVISEYAPALHDTLIDAASFPGACQEVA